MLPSIEKFVPAALPKCLKSISAPVYVAIAYYLGAQAAFGVGTLSDRIFAPLWPPNIVLFCALLLTPTRRWWLYIAVTLPAHAIAEIGVGMPAAQLLVAFVTNCMVAILNAIGVRWLLKEPPWFGTLWSASIYVLITAGAGPAISALGGAFVQIMGGGTDTYWTYWGYWYISNALGAVTVGPAVLIWFNRRPLGLRLRLANPRTIEAVVLGLSLGVVCAIAFHSGNETVATGFLPALLYTPLPLILWAAVRFGQKGASGAILVVTVVSIWQNLRDHTVFIGADPENNVLALQVFLIGLAVPVFLLGAAIDQLNEVGKAMRDLAGKLLRAQDEERRRIARDLHDSTGQNLVVARLMVGRVQKMDPASSGPVVAELKDILQQSINEIRTFAYLLHPPMQDGIGLDSALRSYLDGFSKRTGIDVDLDLSPDIGDIPSGVDLVLFRVIQEALTNVWRHSGSATARIRLVQQPAAGGDQLKLSIEDAGKGIPNSVRISTLSSGTTKQHAPVGLGLVSMRERLHQVGGALEIDSMSGKTVIRAIVTLNAKQPAN